MNFEDVRQGYRNLYARMQILPSRQAEAERVCQVLLHHRERYQIAEQLGVPWYFAAILHIREAGLDHTGRPHFECYLGNGQPLDRVTTAVPAGRGPFTSFEEGTRDALRFMGYDNVEDWSIEAMLYRFEKFNGFGYFSHKVNSPYVWAGSNLYSRGKFDRDGHYNPSLVDQQLGAAVLLKILMGILGMVTTPATPPETPAVPASAETITTPKTDVFIHHVLTAIGAVIAYLGWEHAQTFYDAIINSTFVSGVAVAGLGYFLNHSGIAKANAATIKFLDGVMVKLAELEPPTKSAPPPVQE